MLGRVNLDLYTSIIIYNVFIFNSYYDRLRPSCYNYDDGVDPRCP